MTYPPSPPPHTKVHLYMLISAHPTMTCSSKQHFNVQQCVKLPNVREENPAMLLRTLENVNSSIRTPHECILEKNLEPFLLLPLLAYPVMIAFQEEEFGFGILESRDIEIVTGFGIRLEIVNA